MVDTKKLQKAIDLAKLKLLTWLAHREKFGQGISELHANVIVNYCLCNSLTLLDQVRPSLIFSLLAPCTPFDICITALAQELGVLVTTLNEINLRGFYYITFNQFSHADDIASLSGHHLSFAGKAAATKYLDTFLEESPYYINKTLQSSTSDVARDQRVLRDLSLKSLQQAKALESVNQKPRISHTTRDLQRLGFVSGRDLKHDFLSQAKKEKIRSSYLETMASNLCEIDDEPAILILLDYYPEITRYPIGGDDYFYSNYFLCPTLSKAFLYLACLPRVLYTSRSIQQCWR